MFCENCGKEISDDAKFCQECGTVIEKPAAMPGEGSNGMSESADVSADGNDGSIIEDRPDNGFTPQKKSKKAFLVIALIVVIIFVFVKVAGNNNPDDSLVKSDSDDLFGGAYFDYTIDSYLIEYNDYVNRLYDNEYLSEWNSLSSDDFQSMQHDLPGYTSYCYNYMGYSLNGTQTKYNGSLEIVVNDTTQKVQSVKYIWLDERSYANESNLKMFTETVPIVIFNSLTGGSDWADILVKLENGNSPAEFKKDVVYSYSIESENNAYIQIFEVTAAAKGSEYFNVLKQNGAFN